MGRCLLPTARHGRTAKSDRAEAGLDPISTCRGSRRSAALYGDLLPSHGTGPPGTGPVPGADCRAAHPSRLRSLGSESRSKAPPVRTSSACRRTPRICQFRFASPLSGRCRRKTSTSAPSVFPLIRACPAADDPCSTVASCEELLSAIRTSVTARSDAARKSTMSDRSFSSQYCSENRGLTSRYPTITWRQSWNQL